MILGADINVRELLSAHDFDESKISYRLQILGTLNCALPVFRMIYRGHNGLGVHRRSDLVRCNYFLI